MIYQTLLLSLVVCAIVSGYSLPNCTEVKEQFHNLSENIFDKIDRNVSINTTVTLM